MSDSAYHGHILAQHFIRKRGFRHAHAVGSGFWDTIKNLAKKAGSAIKSQVTNQDSFLRSKVIPLAEQHIDKLAPYLDKIHSSLGERAVKAVGKASEYNERAKALGYGRCGGSYADGCAVARHIVKLHGLSHAGFVGAGFWDSVKNFARKAGETIKNQVTDPNSFLRSKVLPFAAEHIGKVASFLPAGQVLTTGLNLAQKANETAKAHGYGRVGGGGTGRRAMRGAMISKLMQQHKMSLAEASRYIKDNHIQY